MPRLKLMYSHEISPQNDETLDNLRRFSVRYTQIHYSREYFCTYCEAFQYDYTVGSSFQHLFRFCSVNTAHPSPSPLRPRKRSRCRPPSGLIMMYRDLLFRPICLYERSVPSTRLTKSAGTSYTLIYVNWGRPPRRCSMLCLSVMGMYNRPFNPIANRKIPGMHWYLCLIYWKLSTTKRIRREFEKYSHISTLPLTSFWDFMRKQSHCNRSLDMTLDFEKKCK